MPKHSPGDSWTESPSIRGNAETVQNALVKSLPAAFKAVAVTGTIGILAVCLAQIYDCTTTPQLLAYLGSMGSGAFTNLLTGWASQGKKPTTDEVETAICAHMESDSEGIRDIATSLGVLENSIKLLDEDYLRLLTRADEQRLQVHLLGEDIIGILFKQRAFFATRFDDLETLLHEALDNRRSMPGFLWVNVPTKNTHFLGRDTEHANIVSQLLDGRYSAVSIEGKSGVGKSALAMALVYSDSVRVQFADGVLWAGVGPNPDIFLLQQEWAAWIPADLGGVSDLAARRTILSNAVAARRILVVLDDVRQMEHANLLTLSSPNAVHLLTTQSRSLAERYAPHSHNHIEVFDPEEPSFALLRALAPAACAAGEAEARAVARATGGLAVTLSTVGGYLAEPGNSTFAEDAVAALATMRTPAERLAQATQRIGHEGKLSLDSALDVSLSDFTPMQRQAFLALGAFAHSPNRFDRNAAKAVAACDSRTIALLVDRNLVEKDDNFPLARLALHQSLCEFARAHQPPEAQTRHRDHYLAFLLEHENDWQRIEASLPQIEHAWQQLPDDSPLIRKYYGACLAYFTLRSFYVRHKAWATRMLAWATRAYDREAEAVALGNLGNVAMNQGNYLAARDYHRRALELHTQLDNPLGQAVDLGNLGLVAMNQGDYAAARAYHEQALELHTQLGNPLGQAVDLGNLGLVAMDEGDYAAARAYLQQALELDTQLGNPLGQAQDLGNLGLVAMDEGDYAAARAYLQQALELHTQLGNPLGQAANLGNLGLLEKELGNSEAACAALHASAALKRQIGLAVHPSVQKALDALHCPEQ